MTEQVHRSFRKTKTYVPSTLSIGRREVGREARDRYAGHPRIKGPRPVSKSVIQPTNRWRGQPSKRGVGKLAGRQAGRRAEVGRQAAYERPPSSLSLSLSPSLPSSLSHSLPLPLPPHPTLPLSLPPSLRPCTPPPPSFSYLNACSCRRLDSQLMRFQVIDGLEEQLLQVIFEGLVLLTIKYKSSKFDDRRDRKVELKRTINTIRG